MAETAGPNPVALVLRHIVQARLEVLFPEGARVLRIECRTGEEAAALAPAGAGFDGAAVSLGAIGLSALRAVSAAVASAVRPGAGILVSMPGPWPLPAVIRRTLTGVGVERRRGARFEDAVPALATPAEARMALGAAFDITDSYALGVVLPGPAEELWAAAHPQAFGLLAALERTVRRWPGLRQLGDLSVLEGRRRDTA